MTMKICTKCKLEKPGTKEFFYTHPRGKGGLAAICKECGKQNAKAWDAKNGERVKSNRKGWYAKNKQGVLTYNRQRRLAKLGITEQDYNRMFEAQVGLCAICQLPSEQRLAIDHDHVTGIVRGLLCSPCNVALGYFRDRPELLRAAATYLELKTSKL